MGYGDLVDMVLARSGVQTNAREEVSVPTIYLLLQLVSLFNLFAHLLYILVIFPL